MVRTPLRLPTTDAAVLPAFAPPQLPLVSWHFFLLALQASSPSPQITVFSKRPQNVMGSLHHHRPQIPVSFFADFLLWFTLPRVPSARPQPQKTTDLATLWESIRIFYRQDIGQRDLGSHPLHLFEQGHFRVHFLGDFFHPFVVFLDSLVHRFDLSQH